MLSLAGHNMVLLKKIFSSVCLLGMNPLLCFITVILYEFVVAL